MQPRTETDASSHRGPGAFTLIELLVAIAITSIISVALFSLFDSTSQALYEADSLSQSVDSARFTVEKLRSDFKQAGAFGTPDSAWDPQVRPTPGHTVSRGGVNQNIGDYRIAGLVSYDGWQDYASNVMPSDVWSANQDGSLHPDFDGIVLIGAYDYPFMFEVGDITASTVLIQDHPRGLDKIARRNVFNLTRPTAAFDSGNQNPTEIVEVETMRNRILRVRDNNGNYQFGGIAEVNGINNEDLELVLRDFPAANQPLFMKPPSAQDIEFGFPSNAKEREDDQFYASLLDVYWYRVIQNPANPNNFMLVRQRLNGWEVMRALPNWAGFTPENHTVGNYTIIAEQVVDFQIWFDCRESASGAIQELEWPNGWNPPEGTTQNSSQPHHGCLDPNAGAGGGDEPETPSVRMGHIRLSLRSEYERGDMQHNPFPNTGGGQQLEMFDIHPDQKGSTRVYTAQADFELTNYAFRNLTP